VQMPFKFCASSCKAIDEEVERFRAKQQAIPQLSSGDTVTKFKNAES
jgi:hypothetical protein